jgi:hypothetical protein
MVETQQKGRMKNTAHTMKPHTSAVSADAALLALAVEQEGRATSKSNVRTRITVCKKVGGRHERPVAALCLGSIAHFRTEATETVEHGG